MRPKTVIHKFIETKTVIRKFIEMAGYAPREYLWRLYDVYKQDGLLSVHNHDFMRDPSFCKAYEWGCRAAADYTVALACSHWAMGRLYCEQTRWGFCRVWGKPWLPEFSDHGVPGLGFSEQNLLSA
jgi:hypothetical protein